MRPRTCSASRTSGTYLFYEAYFGHFRRRLLWKDVHLPLSENSLVHRILPGIQVIYFDDFKDLTNDYWRKYLAERTAHPAGFEFKFENQRRGGNHRSERAGG
jgi:hypothetical protein